MFSLDYYKIGQIMRKIRKAHGLSQEELTERVNISTTHMSHIETGNTKLSLQVICLAGNARSKGLPQVEEKKAQKRVPGYRTNHNKTPLIFKVKKYPIDQECL